MNHIDNIQISPYQNNKAINQKIQFSKYLILSLL